MTPCTRAAPIASTAIAAHSAESTPPDSPSTTPGTPFRNPEHLLPCRQLQGERAVAVEHEGRAVEHEFVLPADLVGVNERQPGLGDARFGDAVARFLFVHPIGRAVRHD